MQGEKTTVLCTVLFRSFGKKKKKSSSGLWEFIENCHFSFFLSSHCRESLSVSFTIPSAFSPPVQCSIISLNIVKFIFLIHFDILFSQGRRILIYIVCWAPLCFPTSSSLQAGYLATFLLAVIHSSLVTAVVSQKAAVEIHDSKTVRESLGQPAKSLQLRSQRESHFRLFPQSSKNTFSWLIIFFRACLLCSSSKAFFLKIGNCWT